MKIILSIAKCSIIGALISSLYCYVSFYMLTLKTDFDGFYLFLSSYFINGFFVGAAYAIIGNVIKRYCLDRNKLIFTIANGVLSGAVGTLPFIIIVIINTPDNIRNEIYRLTLYYFGVIIISTVVSFVINRPSFTWRSRSD